ncbi:rod shape-determining protein RodA [Bacteroidetes bacterium endosymbiont of Geopemphigus sp.]|uniref:rod shape-determining protein RodA n=1 Tax=Bacteroidetes bacterium endosymbiont of Geopemphigus sp. TaxID=2047937 RepID=UPI000CD1DF0D|nr:rod shape-determining protein RodA [Bacteroidetes bacterium endosymbiont of Geopemphigus sp.]
MSTRKKTLLGHLDWWIIVMYLTLAIFGWINIYSVSEEKAEKQFFWILMSSFLIFLLLLLRPVDYKNGSYVFYFLTLLLLIGVLFLGKTINGSKSWYSLGPVGFQPAELSKISISLALGNILSVSDTRIKDQKTFLMIVGILGLPIALILLQPDPGSILVFFSFILMLYREGMSWRVLLSIAFFIFLFLLALNFSSWIIIGSLLLIFLLYLYLLPKKGLRYWMESTLAFIAVCVFVLLSPLIFQKFLKQHHRDRIEILFKNEFDKEYRLDRGYNLLYSKTAIGSGELLGKGFRKGSITRGKFVPEQHTDYIFCTVGEEWGFVGSTVILIVYLLFIGRIYLLAERQKEAFSRVFGYCVGSIFLLHVIINLGMVMGIMPTVGIPLPFFSYGGSSLWCFTALLFIFVRLNASDRSSLI